MATPISALVGSEAVAGTDRRAMIIEAAGFSRGLGACHDGIALGGCDTGLTWSFRPGVGLGRQLRLRR